MIDNPASNIKIIPAESTYKIRQKILRPGTPVSSCYFPNDFSPLATHFGACRNNEPVGILTACHVPVLEEYFAWQLRAKLPLLLTPLTYVHVGNGDCSLGQGMGYGRRLLQTAENHIRKHSGKMIWCNVRTHAVGFYQKAGFKVSGDRLLIR